MAVAKKKKATGRAAHGRAPRRSVAAHGAGTATKRGGARAGTATKRGWRLRARRSVAARAWRPTAAPWSTTFGWRSTRRRATPTGVKSPSRSASTANDAASSCTPMRCRSRRPASTSRASRARAASARWPGAKRHRSPSCARCRQARRACDWPSRRSFATTCAACTEPPPGADATPSRSSRRPTRAASSPASTSRPSRPASASP